MPADSTILPFCPDVGADNLLDDAAYLAASDRTNGNQPGIADDRLVNKALRQATIVAAGLAAYLADNQNTDVDDDLTVAEVASIIQAALTGAGFARTDLSNTFALSQSIATPNAVAGLDLTRSDLTPTAGDLLSFISSQGYSSAGTERTFASINAVASAVIDAAESGALLLGTIQSGTFANRLSVGAGLYTAGLTDPGAGGANFRALQIAGRTVPGSSSGATQQTVLQGPYNSDGTPNFGGSTGGSSFSTANIGTGVNELIVTVGNGRGTSGLQSLIGFSTANLTWGPFSGTSKYYLLADVDPVTGALAPIISTLPPVYTRDYNLSTTSGQLSYNISDNQPYVGNGSSVVATPRICLGELDVVSGLVTATRFYAYRGYYQTPVTAVSAATTYAFNHNIGTDQVLTDSFVFATTGGAKFTSNVWQDGGVRYGASVDTITPTTMSLAVQNTASVLGSGGLIPFNSAYAVVRRAF